MAFIIIASFFTRPGLCSLLLFPVLFDVSFYPSMD